MFSLDRMNRRYRTRVYVEGRERRRLEERLRQAGDRSACGLAPAAGRVIW